ncbi:hypothetical protein [Myroides odoratus]|uniref:Uncharacterized protein n=1 Tax=Myroides odoratus TaxID=256 RepID=A0A9Q6ZA31_MYROD|nr:hypothetical protein [Myroides odoratus]QQU01213.1 hypothetical protein I6I88_05535 [Myroides odoratus]WQD56529.1 hypothetical protein U0010_13495 [Myroides odoratus]
MYILQLWMGYALLVLMCYTGIPTVTIYLKQIAVSVVIGMVVGVSI